MFRLRDHIISLVAVFLALGLGILIGTGLSEEMLVTQQRLLIEEMSADFRSLREERNQLEARVQTLNRDLYFWQKYEEALYPAIVSGLLQERKIAIIYHASSLPEGVLSLLQDAEAALITVIRVEDKAKIGSSVTGMGTALVDKLTAADLSGGMAEPLASFVESGLITIESTSAEEPDTLLLLLGEKENVCLDFLNELLHGVQEEAMAVVGLETSEVKHSLLGELKKIGASTIDNADTVFGQFSLLSVLRGSVGSFGIKALADEFIATF